MSQTNVSHVRSLLDTHCIDSVSDGPQPLNLTYRDAFTIEPNRIRGTLQIIESPVLDEVVQEGDQVLVEIGYMLFVLKVPLQIRAAGPNIGEALRHTLERHGILRTTEGDEVFPSRLTVTDLWRKTPDGDYQVAFGNCRSRGDLLPDNK